MANITNPMVVNFCNDKLRRLADHIQANRRTIEQFLIDIVPILAIVGADGGTGNATSDPVIDGATVLSGTSDGRRPITKQNILELKYVAEQIVAAENQDDRETLVANMTVNGQPIF